MFAQHHEVLDSIEEFAKKEEINYIRIDGTVKSEIRHSLVEMFQNNEDIKIAILGITAAGVGLTLTAASHVVFAEMHWTPAVLMQAEDRAHRIGQNKNVFCTYLLGEDTLD